MAFFRALSGRRCTAGLAVTAACLVLGLVDNPAAVAAPLGAGIPGLPTGALVVGTASATCPNPGYSSIQDAASAASAGGAIYVCPGTFTGRVTVTKQLRFLGAQFGRDARVGRTDLGRESVVTSPTGGFVINSGVDKVTIDGFTLRGSGSDSQNGDGIDAFNRGAGHTFVNNVFADNTNGMNINSNGSSQTTVQRNRFTANNRSGGQGGTGVTLTSGPANNLLVSDNLFEKHDSAAFNSIGDGSNRSTKLVFRNNRSVDDSSLAVVNNASGARVENNLATKAAALTGTGIYIVGNTDGLVVRGNQIIGGAGNGISANAAFGAGPSTKLTIEANLIKNRAGIGIRVDAAHRSVTIRGNGVFNTRANSTLPGDGIRLESPTSGLTVQGNVALGSAAADCRDYSTGSRTARTANNWTLDAGLKSQPKGLCVPGLSLPGVPRP
jgi:hypothetical protein